MGTREHRVGESEHLVMAVITNLDVGPAGA
jgi:hypothetical protein